jgi:hypothetical protein
LCSFVCCSHVPNPTKGKNNGKVETTSNIGLSKESVFKKTFAKNKSPKEHQWEYKQNTSINGEVSGKQ